MTKMVYFYETVIITHAVEVDVENEDSLEDFIDEVNDDNFSDADNAILELCKLTPDIKVISCEIEYDIKTKEVECDSQDYV